jgi:hypothetical protein
VGPTGLSAECHGESDENRLRFALSGGALWTDITVEGVKTPLTEQTVSASVSARISPRFTLLGGAGGLVGGAVGGSSFGGGALAFFGASYKALAPDGAVPFVSVAATLAALHARAAGNPFTSTDLKLSVSAAWPIAQVFAPYLAAAAFGGPIFYRGGIRGDRYHYQLLAGATVALPKGLDLFLEGSPVGARSLSGGVGLTY